MSKFWMAGLVVAVFGLGMSSMAQDKKSPINAKCPLSGNDVAADKSSEVTIKFCCGNCKGKFEKDASAVLGKVEKLPNDKCPLSGKAVADAEGSVVVGFCCGNCKGKFDADPSKFIGKVKAAEKK